SKIYGSRLVETDPFLFDKSMISILDVYGTILYSIAPENRQFGSIRFTKSYNPEKIIYLNVKQNDDISTISRFKNVKKLEFEHYSGAELPFGIKTLEKLEQLTISNCHKLAYLPDWLNELKNLNKL